MISNGVEEKSIDFSLEAIELFKYLKYEKKEFVLSDQFLRSSTSIGANIKEGVKAQTKKDFLTKMYIALKEANETDYWIQLLKRSDYIDDEKATKMEAKCKELCRMLDKITKTTKQNIQKESQLNKTKKQTK